MAAPTWKSLQVGLAQSNHATFSLLTGVSGGGPGPGTVIRNNRNRGISLLPKSRSPVRPTAPSLLSPAKRPPRPSSARLSNTPDEPTIVGGVTRPPGIYDIPSDDSHDTAGDDINNLVNASTRNQITTEDDHVDPGYQSVNDYRPSLSQPLSAKAKGKQKAVPSKSPKIPPLPQPSSPPPLPGYDDEPGLYVSDAPAPSPSPEHAPVIAPMAQRPTQKRPTPAANTGRREREGTEGERHDQAKRQRQTESVVSRRSEQPPKRGRGRPPKNGVARRGRGRPRKSEMESDGEEGDSLMTLQRGPPMPKSRGLVSMRRETTAPAHQASRGRPSNDVNWWDVQENELAYEAEPPRGQRLNSHAASRDGRRPGGLRYDDEEEPDEWERDPGTMTGEIVLWEPEYEYNPPGPEDDVQVTDERIALTADAIETEGIKDSEARFARTLTLPFMGAGFVDLPPGSEKRPKNSRKMHMVFIVHHGKVTVNVNESEFRISAGGMWFVPRGNYYNIANDYEFPARVYYAQACEVSSSAMEDMTQTTVAA